MHWRQVFVRMAVRNPFLLGCSLLRLSLEVVILTVVVGLRLLHHESSDSSVSLSSLLFFVHVSGFVWHNEDSFAFGHSLWSGNA